MGYTPEKQVKQFLEQVPKFETWLTEAGIILIKLWLEIGKDEQERRFRARVHDPLRQWKLSPMDVKSYTKWYDYSRARDEMFAATDHDAAPWFVLPSDDKKRARLQRHPAHPVTDPLPQDQARDGRAPEARQQAPLR